MLDKTMTLKTMIDLEPTDEDMAMLDLDVVVYIKAVLVSGLKETNHGFIRYMFKREDADEIISTFKDIAKTVFYDFSYNDERSITVFELYAKKPYMETESLLSDILMGYTHEAEVLFDIYTHDSHKYRLSNLDGIVKNDRLR